jgi:hypothetical protein
VRGRVGRSGRYLRRSRYSRRHPRPRCQVNRRCSHCDRDLVPFGWTDPIGYQYAALIHGYCSPLCMRNAALEAVASKTAWWLKEGAK